MAASPSPAIEFDAVDLDRVDTPVLDGVDWRVEPGQRWAVLGPNGSGKTTMVQLCSGYLHPTRGRVSVLGHTLGRVDVRTLRTRIGLVSASVGKMIVPTLTGLDVVVSAAHGALEPWWHRYAGADLDRARGLLDAAGFGHVADRPFGVCSEGERQQILLARSLMGRPELLILDEPAAGLDLAGRERLVSRLAALASDPAAPPTVLVTHHLEEIPPAFDHALLLRAGRVVAAGPVEATLTDEALSAAFGLDLAVVRRHGRWSATAV